MAAPIRNSGLNLICICTTSCKALHGMLRRPAACSVFNLLQTREYKTKHWNPKFRKERAMKTQKIELPDFEKYRREANMTPDEQRAHLKREGMQPPRHHQERDITLASTNSIFEPYVPPEADGVASIISGTGAKQRITELEKKGKSFLQLRKIKQFEEFNSATFADQALDMYIKTHRLLENVQQNDDDLHDLVTEKAYPELVWKLEKKTFRWKYIEALEPARVVHVRTVDMLSKENLYAQVTVRLHSKQTLAIYDRFGRLTYGSENLVKDVLEYVVFEKHLADENSRWRIHGKVVPDWMPSRQQVLRTLRMPNFEKADDSSSDKNTASASS